MTVAVTSNSTCADVDVPRDDRSLGVVGHTAVHLGVNLLTVVLGTERQELEGAVRENLPAEHGSGQVESWLILTML